MLAYQFLSNVFVLKQTQVEVEGMGKCFSVAAIYPSCQLTECLYLLSLGVSEQLDEVVAEFLFIHLSLILIQVLWCLVGLGESEELVKEVASLRARLESTEDELRSRESTIEEMEAQLQRARAEDLREKMQVRLCVSYLNLIILLQLSWKPIYVKDVLIF